VERESVLDVKVEPGMQEGDRITFVGQCSESPQFERPGDVILIIRSANTDSEEWVRNGAELTYTVELTMAEMMLGWQRVIAGHPSGQPLNVAWTGGVLLEGSVLVLAGMGMPNRSGTKGDLKLVCRTQKTSTGLSDAQKYALKMVWTDWKEVVISDQSTAPVLLA
jgi:DnaJ-class molecular chaperone